MNKTFLFIIILAVVFIGVVVFLGNREGEEEVGFPQGTPTLPILSPTPSEISQPSPTGSGEIGTTPTAVIPKTVTVNMTDSGFNPVEITINAGDTVRFVNQGNQLRRPASGIHPTHDLYPEKGGCISSKFDACRGLQNGESFSFTFNLKGTWPYHDHLAPSVKGTIIVQ